MRVFASLMLLALIPLAHAAGHPGHAAPAWTELPLIEAVPGRDRALAAFRLRNLAADSVKAHAPGPQARLPEGLRFQTERLEWDILTAAGRFQLQAGGVGNYHWLLAREETSEAVKVASTAHYFSNPGPAPTAMLARPKSELEIVPAPLPREHNRYRENQEGEFLLRFQGQPLPGATLRFASNAGTQASFTSDAAGRARVRFPDDVKEAATGHGGHGGRASNRFVLAVEHDAGGRHYLTTFNYSYAEDAYTNRSLAWGGGFLALGGLIGLPLIIRRKEEHRG
ncbi:MAG: hypothetical protein Q8O33_04375 [Pseudomonadota bacterium]|nr:hypothetical protein [Pseudomonadota bacterium]